jgi:repressor LexA
MLTPDPPQTVGHLIRERRQKLGLTLHRLARLARCAPSYLSAIENHRRDRPPSEKVLDGIESALGLPRGRLRDAARWQQTPAQIQRQVARLTSQQQAARRMAELISGASAGGGKKTRSLDSLYRSGELRRLIDQIAPESATKREKNADRLALPREVPLINSVAAGYPTEFTDLGYPARVADEYIRTPDIADADAFGARVVGDSMMPEYREGDIVVFSPARTVKSGMDCFARLEPDHETTFKRVYFESAPGGEELIRLQPLNPAYPSRVMGREQVAGLYAAVSVTRAV